MHIYWNGWGRQTHGPITVEWLKQDNQMRYLIIGSRNNVILQINIPDHAWMFNPEIAGSERFLNAMHHEMFHEIQ